MLVWFFMNCAFAAPPTYFGSLRWALSIERQFTGFARYNQQQSSRFAALREGHAYPPQFRDEIAQLMREHGLAELARRLRARNQTPGSLALFDFGCQVPHSYSPVDRYRDNGGLIIFKVECRALFFSRKRVSTLGPHPNLERLVWPLDRLRIEDEHGQSQDVDLRELSLVRGRPFARIALSTRLRDRLPLVVQPQDVRGRGREGVLAQGDLTCNLDLRTGT